MDNKPGPGRTGETKFSPLADSAGYSDPGARGGPLGALDEMPEGGDSTRFPRRPVIDSQDRKNRQNRDDGAPRRDDPIADPVDEDPSRQEDG